MASKALFSFIETETRARSSVRVKRKRVPNFSIGPLKTLKKGAFSKRKA